MSIEARCRLVSSSPYGLRLSTDDGLVNLTFDLAKPDTEFEYSAPPPASGNKVLCGVGVVLPLRVRLEEFSESLGTPCENAYRSLKSLKKPKRIDLSSGVTSCDNLARECNIDDPAASGVCHVWRVFRAD